jgi:hypothetical protein
MRKFWIVSFLFISALCLFAQEKPLDKPKDEPVKTETPASAQTPVG